MLLELKQQEPFSHNLQGETMVSRMPSMGISSPPGFTNPISSLIAAHESHHHAQALLAARADQLGLHASREFPQDTTGQRPRSHPLPGSAFTPTTAAFSKRDNPFVDFVSDPLKYTELSSSPVKPAHQGISPFPRGVPLAGSFPYPGRMIPPIQQPYAFMNPQLSSAATYPPFMHMLSAAGQFLPYGYPTKKMFRCADCRYMTDRKNNLKRHMATMHGDCDKVLECCDITFKSKASLREHVLLFHQAGYRCRHCGRNFCRKALLKRHLAVHNGQKEFCCEECDYATSHKSNLERHRKVHDTSEDGTPAEDQEGYLPEPEDEHNYPGNDHHFKGEGHKEDSFDTSDENEEIEVSEVETMEENASGETGNQAGKYKSEVSPINHHQVPNKDSKLQCTNEECELLGRGQCQCTIHSLAKNPFVCLKCFVRFANKQELSNHECKGSESRLGECSSRIGHVRHAEKKDDLRTLLGNESRKRNWPEMSDDDDCDEANYIKCRAFPTTGAARAEIQTQERGSSKYSPKAEGLSVITSSTDVTSSHTVHQRDLSQRCSTTTLVHSQGASVHRLHDINNYEQFQNKQQPLLIHSPAHCDTKEPTNCKEAKDQRHTAQLRITDSGRNNSSHSYTQSADVEDQEVSKALPLKKRCLQSS